MLHVHACMGVTAQTLTQTCRSIHVINTGIYIWSHIVYSAERNLRLQQMSGRRSSLCNRQTVCTVPAQITTAQPVQKRECLLDIDNELWSYHNINELDVVGSPDKVLDKTQHSTSELGPQGWIRVSMKHLYHSCSLVLQDIQ